MREAIVQLPEPTADETALSRELRALIGGEIERAGGALGFDRFMELALYAPGLGYYANARRKFGDGGDFVTAPELSPLFSRCVARSIGDGLAAARGGDVLEFGAGSGRMAADILAELDALDRLPRRYAILELSPSLRALQHDTLQASVPHLLERVEWLDGLPEAPFDGVVVANEVLDAMPVHRFRRTDAGWQELAVGLAASGFEDRWQPLRSADLVRAVEAIWPDSPPDPGYASEVNLRIGPWLDAIAAVLRRGTVLLIDYGYSRREYYHPERQQGTLICHFRHRTHPDPYRLPGLQDITANVDFTAVALAAQAAGFDVAAYTTQAHFLLDNGLDRLLASSDPNDVRHHMTVMQGVKKLTLPSEMGERFKVMMLTRGVDASFVGVQSRDLRARL